ncbi:hypothetical protein PFISCL1PPCAC_9208, partial [Pristionchus fissidentatus]
KVRLQKNTQSKEVAARAASSTAAAAAAAMPLKQLSRYFSANAIDKLAELNLYAVPLFIIAACLNLLIYIRASCKPFDPHAAVIPSTVQYTAFYIFLFPSGIYIGIFLLIVSAL